MNPHSQETVYLRRLIEDFPAETKPEEAPEALRTIAIRYQTLENERAFRGISAAQVKESDVINDLSQFLKRRAFFMHRFLFKDILSNAGKARKSSDPNGGRIGFGGMEHQQHRSQFVGATCDQIDQALNDAFSYLILDPEDPVENAMRFYQHFVYVHPFYDANGRIGRVTVSTYLNLFDYYLQWGAFDGANNSKFIRKLNKCHKRMESGFQFEQYFNYLLNFFKNYVISFDELSDFF